MLEDQFGDPIVLGAVQKRGKDTANTHVLNFIIASSPISMRLLTIVKLST